MEFGFWILDFGFWILDFGFWILDFGFWILDLGFWILDFGFWILDFGFWSLDFGFWLLDQFSIRSFCGGPKRRRLDFGFWILEFGFWILDFGLDEALLDIVWILHKIFPCHADSGRRIYIYISLRIMGSQNSWFGDPRTLLYRVQPLHRRVCL